MVNDARGTVEMLERAMVRETVATRRTVSSVRKDILSGFVGEVLDVFESGLIDCRFLEFRNESLQFLCSMVERFGRGKEWLVI